MYAVTYDLPVVVTRCGNFYGGGDLNWNRIIRDHPLGAARATAYHPLRWQLCA